MRRIALLLTICFSISISGGEFRPFTASSTVGGRTYEGEVLDCDFPGNQHIRNIGSYRDGAGMCVNSSIEMAALFAGMEEYRGFRNWSAQYGGGSYPSKVDSQLAAYAKAKGLADPQYMQYEGPNLEVVIEAALRSGRVACITYGKSPRYLSPVIAHMTCMVKFSGKYAVVLDNNFPGEDKYEWMSKEEAIKRVKWPGSTGWVFVWLYPPPPPSPKN